VNPKSQPARSLWFALVLWVGLSVLALTVASSSVLAGLVVAGMGGGLFGILSAARLDGRKRRRRRRSAVTTEDSHVNHVEPAPDGDAA
jgi:hypothetical protein